jgi:hypothetical protein
MEHKFLVAAYCCTWGIQLGYLLWIVRKWLGQRPKTGTDQ